LVYVSGSKVGEIEGQGGEKNKEGDRGKTTQSGLGGDNDVSRLKKG